MNKIKIINWLCVIVTICLCFFWYHMSNTNNDNLVIDKESLKNSIDMTINNINIKEFNANGKLTNFIESKEVNHIPQHDTHILTNPHIIVKEGEQLPWDINAKSATATHGGQKVTFSKDVKIIQKQPSNIGNIQLYTDKITYFPNKKYAITKNDVKLQQNNSIVEATGLKAYLTESRIQFLKNARGRYEQNNG